MAEIHTFPGPKNEVNKIGYWDVIAKMALTKFQPVNGIYMTTKIGDDRERSSIKSDRADIKMMLELNFDSQQLFYMKDKPCGDDLDNLCSGTHTIVREGTTKEQHTIYLKFNGGMGKLDSPGKYMAPSEMTLRYEIEK